MYAFVDVETTGLDPARHEIIEIGAVLASDDFDAKISFARKVAPSRIESADSRALEINGFTPESWCQAIPLPDALMSLRPIIEGEITIAGWHPEFDVGFLRYAFDVCGIEWPNARRRTLDVCSCAQLIMPGLDNYSLESVAKRLGITPGGHRALEDAMCALNVAKELRRFVL